MKGEGSLRFGLADEKGRVLVYIAADVDFERPLIDTLLALQPKFKLDKKFPIDYLLLNLLSKKEPLSKSSEGSLFPFSSSLFHFIYFLFFISFLCVIIFLLTLFII